MNFFFKKSKRKKEINYYNETGSCFSENYFNRLLVHFGSAVNFLIVFKASIKANNTFNIILVSIGSINKLFYYI